MSDLKMLCPSCGSSTTAIRTAAEDGEPCPYCGRVLPEVGAASETTPLVTALADVWPDTFGEWTADQADAARAMKQALLRALTAALTEDPS